MNWKAKSLGESHTGGCNDFSYYITKDASGHVSWSVNGPDDHAGGLAENVLDAKVQCDAARRLLECLAWLRGARWEGADEHAIIDRLEPFLVDARALQLRSPQPRST